MDVTLRPPRRPALRTQHLDMPEAAVALPRQPAIRLIETRPCPLPHPVSHVLPHWPALVPPENALLA